MILLFSGCVETKPVINNTSNVSEKPQVVDTAISDLATRVACMNRELFFHGEKEEFFANKDMLKTYSESAMQLHMHKHDM